MKRYISAAFLLSAPLFAGSLFPLHAQNIAENRKNENMRDGLGGRKLHLHLQNAKTSDQLLALAKAGEFSLFADATFFPASSQALSIDAENASLNWMLEIAAQENLSMRRINQDTVLFWKAPDVSTVAKALLAKLGDVKLPPIGDQNDEGKTSALSGSALMRNTRTQETGLLLANYLQQRGWDGNSPTKQEFLLSDLPPEAGSKLLALARSSLRESQQSARQSWMQDALWLSDESWQGARLLYAKPSRLAQPLLSVCITNGNSESFLALDDLIDPSPLTPEQQEVKEAPHQIATENLTRLNETQLSRETALATPINLSVKAMPVKELLAQLQKQSGVVVDMPPDSLPNKTVTCFASKTSLYQCMNALSGLYGVEWSKAPDGAYWMQSPPSTAEANLLQIGDPQWFRYWQSRIKYGVAPERLTLIQPVDWEGELMNAGVAETALQAPDGIKVSTLNPELQSLLQKAVEDHFAFLLAVQYRNFFSNPGIWALGPQGDITVQVVPAAKVAVARTLSDNSPRLQVNLVKEGTTLYSLPIYGSQVRQILQEMVNRNNGYLLQMQARETTPRQ